MLHDLLQPSRRKGNFSTKLGRRHGVAGKELLSAKWRIDNETDDVPFSQVLVVGSGIEFSQGVGMSSSN